MNTTTSASWKVFAPARRLISILWSLRYVVTSATNGSAHAYLSPVANDDQFFISNNESDRIWSQIMVGDSDAAALTNNYMIAENVLDMIGLDVGVSREFYVHLVCGVGTGQAYLEATLRFDT
jgi:hypothetical protein